MLGILATIKKCDRIKLPEMFKNYVAKNTNAIMPKDRIQ